MAVRPKKSMASTKSRKKSTTFCAVRLLVRFRRRLFHKPPSPRFFETADERWIRLCPTSRPLTPALDMRCDTIGRQSLHEIIRQPDRGQPRKTCEHISPHRQRVMEGIVPICHARSYRLAHQVIGLREAIDDR